MFSSFTLGKVVERPGEQKSGRPWKAVDAQVCTVLACAFCLPVDLDCVLHKHERRNLLLRSRFSSFRQAPYLISPCHAYASATMGSGVSFQRAGPGSGRRRRATQSSVAFCDLELLEESLGKQAWKALHALDQDVFDLARVGEVSPQVEEIERLVEAPELSVQDQWRACLKKRERLRASRLREERRSYRKKVEKGRARVRLKFFPEKHRRIPHSGHLWRHRLTPSVQAHVRDAASNDTGLPAAHLTNNAAMVEKWCKWGSWTICPTCHSVQPRRMKNIDARRLAGPHRALRDCRACKAAGGRNSSVTAIVAVPRALRKLNARVVKALRPWTWTVGRCNELPKATAYAPA